MMETSTRNYPQIADTSYEDEEESSPLLPTKAELKTEVSSHSFVKQQRSTTIALLGLMFLMTVSMVWSQRNILRTTTTLVALDDGTNVPVKCRNVHMPELTSPTRIYRYSRICYPDDGNKHPLHFFAHGDFGGGPFGAAYNGILHDIAGRGFATSMYLSCAIDWLCENGNGSFLEILKSATFLETNDGWWNDVIDFDAGYSASGHSTGGRVVLMLAALIDNPTKYLMDTHYASMITEEHRRSLQKFDAVVGDRPDPVYLSEFNPDPDNFVVNQTPVMIITGSKDAIEPELSAWKIFQSIASPYKVYVNLLGTGHLGPLRGHIEGPFIAEFSKCFVRRGNRTGSGSDECEAIYGTSGSNTIRKALPIAGDGDRNSGDGRVGFLGCRGGNQDDVPTEYAPYCSVGT